MSVDRLVSKERVFTSILVIVAFLVQMGFPSETSFNFGVQMALAQEGGPEVFGAFCAEGDQEILNQIDRETRSIFAYIAGVFEQQRFYEEDVTFYPNATELATVQCIGGGVSEILVGTIDSPLNIDLHDGNPIRFVFGESDGIARKLVSIFFNNGMMFAVSQDSDGELGFVYSMQHDPRDRGAHTEFFYGGIAWGATIVKAEDGTYSLRNVHWDGGMNQKPEVVDQINPDHFVTLDPSSWMTYLRAGAILEGLANPISTQQGSA